MKKFEAHILVVDDDDRIRDLVKQYLNEKNYLVTTANNAEDAQEKVSIIFYKFINFRKNLINVFYLYSCDFHFFPYDIKELLRFFICHHCSCKWSTGRF